VIRPRKRDPAPGRQAFPAAALLLFCGLAFACNRGRANPGTVADRFVDKYYVESDQQGALEYAGGVAALKLRDELKLAAEGRRPGMDMVSRQIRVYYRREGLSGEGDLRRADYHLDIRPQGGGELKREAHLELQRGPDGWRVVRFHETQPGL
jgi:hypothetical protein